MKEEAKLRDDIQKEQRYIAKLQLAQKKMWIKKSQLSLKDELLLYPRGKHDDLLDGLYYAMKKCYPPNHVVEDKEKKFNNKSAAKKFDWKTS